ncbi:MAG: MetQ/NlpA family ABC transporter substrate-binding protein [Deltaproteobacteria bacterium]|jgi:D-methionine transport system substrate-binding protein|nr:MetQ/NlpA family ABC transporter substrate-binding protein [Deltaproteobacteria bacterium]
MKSFLLVLSLFVLCAGGASPALAAQDLVVGVNPFPHKDIMLVIKTEVAEEGYNLIIKEFSDYVLPNLALAEGELFANFFQHIPYLENMNQQKELDLVWIAKVHIEPLGLYSKKIKNIGELKSGDLVALPNDPTNGARALRLLQANGLIEVKEGDLVTVRDITANPRGLRFREIEAAQLPRSLDDVTAAVINANFAGQANLNPANDALVVEKGDSPYANVVVVRAQDQDSPAAKALQKAANSPAVKAMIEKSLTPKGILPAF